MKSFLFFLLCTLCLLACGTSQKSTRTIDTIKTAPIVAQHPKTKNTKYQFPYQLDQPAMKATLPPELNEISGLSITSEKEICAIQDENGILFYLDKENGEIVRTQNWYKDGDYEGVECVDDTIYVVKSNGKLFELSPSDADTLQRVLYKSEISKKDDIEGLSYDHKGNRLILFCKGKGSESEENLKQCKAFSFCLSEKKIDTLAEFSLKLAAVKSYINQLKEHKHLDKIKEFFSSEKELPFAPSAVAIHPITQNIYLTSSKGKLLLVMNPDKKVLHIEKLSKKMHPQPEGLAFDKDGTLFISNEAKKENPAILYRFSFNQSN